MELPKADYDYESLISTVDEKSNQSNLQIITLLYKPSKEKTIGEIFQQYGFKVDNSYGDIIQIKQEYNLYETTREVSYYVARHPDNVDILILFTFNGIADIYRTLRQAVERSRELYYLWLPPRYFDNLKDQLVENSGAYITYFHGKSMGMGKKECRRPKFARDVKYKGDDALEAMEELRFEYGVLPQTIEFVIPSTSKFKVYKDGFYSLQYGEVKPFLDNVIGFVISSVMKDNRRIEDAKVEIVKNEKVERLSIKEVKFQLEEEIEFEEFEDFLEDMEENDFGVYNLELVEGSVIFSANIVDEHNGNIFSATSDGKQFTLVPKYDSNNLSIIRFHRFLLEKIDEMTTVLHENANQT